jgi:hypothetical protein
VAALTGWAAKINKPLSKNTRLSLILTAILSLVVAIFYLSSGIVALYLLWANFPLLPSPESIEAGESVEARLKSRKAGAYTILTSGFACSCFFIYLK